MSDRLTQLQDCLDQLLIQMFASIRYIDTRHGYQSIAGQVDQFAPHESAESTTGTQTQANPQSQTLPPTQTQTQTQTQLQPPVNAAANTTQDQLQQQQLQSNESLTSSNPQPDAPDLFSARMTELAQDLVLKEQQIEALIGSLPGIGNSQRAQEKRLRALNREMKRVEGEREEWKREWERLVGVVDGWIVDGVRRV